jgi:signal recognition particle subunit SRP54
MFDYFSQKFTSLFSRLSGSKKLSAEAIEQFLGTIRDALLEADVPYNVAQQFVHDIEQEVVGETLVGALKADEFMMNVVREKLLAFLGGKADEKSFVFKVPATIVMMGLQGSGKTTTVGKIAHYSRKIQSAHKSIKILVASVDFYRPAAVDQLEIVAKNAGVDFYRAQAADVINATLEIKNYAATNNYDLLIVDTAGRLHVDVGLLDELKKIYAVLVPQYSFLVLDAMTGQESLKVAKAFQEVINFTGAIITKLDSDARGGVAFSFRYVIKKPILFVGSGEKVADLEPFRPERMVNRMLGGGDLVTLAERAQEKIKQHEQEEMEKALKTGTITLEDFARQMDMIGRLGSLSQVARYIPGFSGANISAEMLEKGEVEMRKFRAILSSMTRKERLMPKILNASRKQRIAKGSGVEVAAVNNLLRRFDESVRMLRTMKNMGFLK